MAYLYLFSVLIVLGFSQGLPSEVSDQTEIIPSEPAYYEDLRSASSRIVAGWPAEEGQFPYMVSLRMVGPTGGVGACGGSLLNNQWILTAAHCLARRFTYVVRFGVYNLTRSEYVLDAYRTDAHIHEGYDETDTTPQTHDIGLLKVDREIPYGPNIQPIRMQSRDRIPFEYGGDLLTVAGFGRTDDFWLGGIIPEILYWTHQVGVTIEDCLLWYRYSQVIREAHMCAQYHTDPQQNTCQGDSGSALTKVDIDGQLTLVGILSFGAARGCNTPNPSGYVRPEFYHDWITEKSGIDFDWRVSDLIDG